MVRPLLGAVEVVDDLTFSSRAVVARLRQPDGTVVVAKRHKDPDAAASEELALRTLPAGIGPRLVGIGDGVLVMEDVGAGPSVADLLLGPDPMAARAAPVGWAGVIGRVAAATRDPARTPGGWWVRPDPAELIGLFDRLGVPAPAGWSQELADLSAHLDADDRHRSLVITDACPDNNRVTDSGVRLFDFEASRWGHAAQDASYLLAPFCTCWCVSRLPAAVSADMIDAYRRAYPGASDPGFIDLAVAAGVLLVLATLPYIAAAMEQPDQRRPPQAPVTTRQYLYLRLEWLARPIRCGSAYRPLRSRTADGRT